MFCKSLIVFGLLAAFSVQGMGANQLDARTVDLRALSDLVDQVQDLIANLNEIISGVAGNALGTLKGLIDTIKAIREKSLNKGLGAITDIVGDALNFIANKTEEAAKLGIDVSSCIAGKQDQLEDLATSQAGELSDCVCRPISAALEMGNYYLKIVGEITKNVTNLPAQLAKCLVSRKPTAGVTNMVNSLTQVVLELPDQIREMIEEVFKFVDSLTGTLGDCVNGVTVTANSKVQPVIEEVSKCVDELMPEETFRF